jgi:hypothetical protein
MTATALLKQTSFTHDFGYVHVAHQTLAQMQSPTGTGIIAQHPLGFG